ncbi:GNAT family N-acetyltransferase [Mesorhizobium sp. B3-1-9]|uniref:GNAT family N-acetyltransferase n=1 Tax=unclassified Mesorhizobium TaxID=325217 RepID=UPI001128D537|nr:MULTISPECIES: GNAT family N-acetyltransferase [unclassified Mesorhizobium]TPI39727.1 GNAT family N-acetyltransferase [Mesorhizobium sp. B3-1-9]UCI23297.1 GNAT family N-acetyltransferase [Mesorhizobium sp. B2-8-5]
MNPFRIEKLARGHPVEKFDCGEQPLNRFLARYAFQNQQANASQTYIGLSSENVIGFYTLVVGEVAYDDAPDRLKKGLARHPVPIMLLARLAVSLDWQGRGVGAGLLRDAVLRSLRAADIAGIRAITVHAKGDNARSFYERYGFIQSPTDPLHLYVLIKDLRNL